MPHSIYAGDEGAFIELRLWGKVNVAEVFLAIEDLLNHREFEAAADHLIDCSDANIVGLTPRIMLAIREITRSTRGGRRALIVPPGPIPTMIALYLRLRGNDARIRVFKSRNEAFLWFGRTPIQK